MKMRSYVAAAWSVFRRVRLPTGCLPLVMLPTSFLGQKERDWIMKLRIARVVLSKDCDCEGCGCPLFHSEIAYREDVTGTVGHSEQCCCDAVEALLDHHEVAAFRAGFDLNVMAGGVA